MATRSVVGRGGSVDCFQGCAADGLPSNLSGSTETLSAGHLADVLKPRWKSHWKAFSKAWTGLDTHMPAVRRRSSIFYSTYPMCKLQITRPHYLGTSIRNRNRSMLPNNCCGSLYVHVGAVSVSRSYAGQRAPSQTTSMPCSTGFSPTG